MTHQWDQGPPHSQSLRGDPVTDDLSRYLAEQDRADARAKEVERMAGEVLGDPDHYDGLLERLAGDDGVRRTLCWLFKYENSQSAAWQFLKESLKEAAHAYADENLEKLLEGQQ